MLRQSSFIVEWLHRSILYVILIRTHDVGMGRRLVRLRADEASLSSLCPIFDRSKTGRKNRQPALSSLRSRRGARCGWTVTALGTTNQKGSDSCRGHPVDSLLRRSDSDSYTVPAHQLALPHCVRVALTSTSFTAFASLHDGPETPYRPRPPGPNCKMLLFHRRVRTDSVTRTVKNGHTDMLKLIRIIPGVRHPRPYIRRLTL